MRYTNATRCVTFGLIAGLSTSGAAHARLQPPALPNVQIKRVFEIKLANQSFKLFSKARTVAELLKEANIPASDKLMVRPALGDSLEGVKEVVLSRLTLEVMEFQTEIPAPEKTIRETLAFNSKVPQNQEKVTQEGKDGKATLKNLYFFQDGQLLGYTEKTIVREAPQTRVVVRYDNPPKTDSEALNRFMALNFRKNKKDPGLPIPKGPALQDEFRSKVSMSATAYTSDDPGVGTRTAMGWRLRQGIVAVDPRRIPLGTRLFIPGYGYGVAADTGGAIKGNKIDLAFGSRKDAFRFGRRKVDVYLLD